MKKLLISIFIVIFSNCIVLANEIPVSIAPACVISTYNNEYSVGDKIKFAVAKDVYIDNKLYIKAETPVIATLDYYSQNGWFFDNAQLTFTPFKTKDIKGNDVIIDDKLMLLPRKLEAKTKFALCSKYLVCSFIWIIRGQEIYIEPDNESYTVYINR